MIEYISGELKEKNPAAAVIDINGIAYKLFIPYSTYEKLPAKGAVTLFTSLIVQGGMQSTGELKLYGFVSREERQVFQLLCSVTRVGPLLALRILSGSSVGEIKNAIVSENADFLSKIKGVGLKTAQRIIIELKDSFKDWNVTGVTKADDNGSVATEAVLALVALGYQRNLAEKSVREALQKPMAEISTEILVKQVLKGG
ncbi:MAG: Holliday junction branch migration protein RuvA [Planctomycetes bacterium]|nr:Holliday junction branch migration protein RuvA [Planctomycetota bacterium]